MTRRAARVTQSEVENVVKGVQAAGMRVSEVRILPDWTIVISSQPQAGPGEALSASGVVRERLRQARNGNG
jgi:hypothetical protein